MYDEATEDEPSRGETTHDDGPQDHTGDYQEEELLTNDPDEQRCTGAIFHRSRDFAVSGGVFTSNVTNYIHQAHPVPKVPNFRRIPLGDIYLQNEIDQSVVYLERDRMPCVRRVYSGKIDERSPNMTVAIYQGKHGEQAWREATSKHSLLRHPNLRQLFGTARSSGMCATIYYDVATPLPQFLAQNRYSPALAAYIHAYASQQWGQWMEAADYVYSVSQEQLICHRTWVQPSTGRVSFELTNRPMDFMFHKPKRWQRICFDFELLQRPDAETAIGHFVPLEIYHQTVRKFFRSSVDDDIQCRLSRVPISLGSIIQHTDKGARGRVASVSFPWEFELQPDSSLTLYTKYGATIPKTYIADGWTRLSSQNINIDYRFHYKFCRKIAGIEYKVWLSQANHIFNCLQATSDLEDFYFAEVVLFILIVSYPPPEDGYLFLCPPDHFCVGQATYDWPECPCYWSLDPSGKNSLSVDEAEKLGFPTLRRTKTILGCNWDTSDYAGLSIFHQAEGFNPYSQEVAQHLGYPLYRLLDEQLTQFELVPDGSDSDAEEHSEHPCSHEDYFDAIEQNSEDDGHKDEGSEVEFQPSMMASPRPCAEDSGVESEGSFAVGMQKSNRAGGTDFNASDDGEPLVGEPMPAFADQSKNPAGNKSDQVGNDGADADDQNPEGDEEKQADFVLTGTSHGGNENFAEMLPVSQAYECLLGLKITLMLFIFLAWLYETAR